MKKSLRILFALILLFVFVGCGNTTTSQYNESIESAQNYIADEDYKQAEMKFQEALESRPEDDYAAAGVEQIRFYMDALNEFENDEHEAALRLAKNATKVADGSKDVSAKSKELMQTIQEDMGRQQADREAAEDLAEKDGTVEAAADASFYTYEDFKGIYALFEGEPYDSKIVMIYILSDDYLTDAVTDWNEYSTMEISSVTIENDRLYLDYEETSTYPPGPFIAQLQPDENSLVINGRNLYELSREQFNALDFSIDEALLSGL